MDESIPADITRIQTQVYQTLRATGHVLQATILPSIIKLLKSCWLLRGKETFTCGTMWLKESGGLGFHPDSSLGCLLTHQGNKTQTHEIVRNTKTQTNGMVKLMNVSQSLNKIEIK